MDRQNRHNSRRNHHASRLDEHARALIKTMRDAGITPEDQQMFLKWAVSSLWSNYKEERMNQRIMIESRMQGLGLRLPNGTANKPYKFEFELPVDGISDVRMIGAEELGLALSQSAPGRYELSGKAERSGDFKLILRYDTVEGEPPSEMMLPIAFNPDPRSLWRNIPTDENITFYKPDSDTACVRVEREVPGDVRKNIVAASQRGRSHAQEGNPRDDHFSIYHCDQSDWYILAVADGAGSARFSRMGSKVACETVMENCKATLLDNPGLENAIKEYAAAPDDTARRQSATHKVVDLLYKSAIKAHEAIKRTAAVNDGSRLKDFATTLMFAVCKKYDFGWFIASFWVGDGAMAIFDARTGQLKLLGTPDEGEFSGQTRFLTMPEIFHDKDLVSKRMRMTIVPDFTALFLMTDGVSDPMFETDRNLNDCDKWKQFYESLRGGFQEDGIKGVNLSYNNDGAKDELLAWLDFWSPGNHDDRTIAILY